VPISATYFSHEEPPQPCGNKHSKGHFQNLNDLLALLDARGRNKLISPIDLQSTQRCHPCCGVPFGASISVNQRTATSCHSVVHFPVWGGRDGSLGLKEHLPTYLVALSGVSNQFQDDTLRLHPWRTPRLPESAVPSNRSRVYRPDYCSSRRCSSAL
jgi:hypothetical protein